MEIRFTASVGLAINCVMQLVHGKLPNAESPAWQNFFFFHRIAASPIQRSDSAPCLSREVRFYCANRLLVRVQLLGDDWHGSDEDKGWFVTRVDYFKEFDGVNTPKNLMKIYFGLQWPIYQPFADEELRQCAG
jgi:hypothetical protein